MDFGIPLFELPVLLGPKDDRTDTDFTPAKRELAFRGLYFTFYNILSRMGKLRCVAVKDKKRFVLYKKS